MRITAGEWLGDARPARAIEETTHLLVDEVARREDHALGMRRVVAAQPLEELFAREIGHPHVDDHRVIRRCPQTGEGVFPAGRRLDVVAAAGEIAL